MAGVPLSCVCVRARTHTHTHTLIKAACPPHVCSKSSAPPALLNSRLLVFLAVTGSPTDRKHPVSDMFQFLVEGAVCCQICGQVWTTMACAQYPSHVCRALDASTTAPRKRMNSSLPACPLPFPNPLTLCVGESTRPGPQVGPGNCIATAPRRRLVLFGGTHAGHLRRGSDEGLVCYWRECDAASEGLRL